MARVSIVAGLASSLVNFRGPLIEALLEKGHEVDVIAPSIDDRTAKWLSERGVTSHTVHLSRVGTSPLGDLRTLISLVRLFRKTAPDAVIAYTIKPVIYGVLAAWLAGVPSRHALITGLGYAFTDGPSSVHRRILRAVATTLYRIALSRADAIVFQNEDDRADFQAAGILGHAARTTIVNGSGVDIDHFSPVPLPDSPRFLLIARLVADKGIVEYIEAARIVRDRLTDAEFHLVGPRDSNPASLPEGLVDAAVSDGLLVYHGELSDIRPQIATASIYVLPSYREGTPRSVLEAMAMGRPVITTDAPGCRATTVHGSTGLLVPPRAVAELAEAMERLGADAGLRARMGGAARARVKDLYDARAVARSVLDACAL